MASRGQEGPAFARLTLGRLRWITDEIGRGGLNEAA